MASERAAAAAIFEAGSRPTFRERVAALVGHGTWREPSDGGRTAERQIPADHLVAAALSFGKRGEGDIGPDIAFDMATGRTGHYVRVIAWLGRTMAGERSAAVMKNRAHIGMAATLAYRATVLGEKAPPPPEGVTEPHWQELLLFGCLLLEYAAEDALALAERKHRAREVGA
jgi:hypothetical protein